MANYNRIAETTINWNRCVYINSNIDESLINKLMPEILRLRQESNDPITVAINSPGGSVTAAETLLGLIAGPHQDLVTCNAITVSVNHAYSAAATLLALGDYAVALPGSDILFHDVRFSGLENITPTVAKAAAIHLQNANDELALKLANRIFRRLVWNYIDLRSDFDSMNKKFSKIHNKYAGIVSMCDKGTTTASVDIASFATSLYAKLSSYHLIDEVMDRLNRWGGMMTISESIPDYRQKGKRTLGLLDGPKNLYRSMRELFDLKDEDVVWNSFTPDFKLFITLLIENLAKEKQPRNVNFTKILAAANDDFKLINSINDPSHFRTATKQLLRHKGIFFSEEALAELESGDEQRREAALKEAVPTAKLFWHFCVLLCTELFNGEHILTPYDAQLLGLVDEVGGGGHVESRREFNIKNNELDKPPEIV